MQSLPLTENTDKKRRAVSILDLVSDVIVWIALFNPDTFYGLALCHPRFARILRRPFVQSLAKDRFTLHCTFVQADAPFYMVCTDQLPNGTLRNVRLCDKDTGIVCVEAKFVNGHRHGIEKRYDYKGRLERVTTYQKGNRNGLDTVYDEDGKTVSVTDWVDNDTVKSKTVNLGDYSQIEQRYTNGHLRESRTTIDGKLMRISRYRVESRIPGRNGGLHKHDRPSLIEREPNRKKDNPATHAKYALKWIEPNRKRSIPVEHLLQHGKQVIFHPNGQLALISEYKDGLLDGSVKSYAPDGKMFKYEKYAHGLVHGPTIRYHPNGKPSHIDIWENGVPAGCWVSYYDCGTIKRQLDRAAGNCVRFDPDGKLASMLECDNHKKVKYTEYYPDGVVKAVEYYRDNLITARHEFSPDGSLSVLELCRAGQPFQRREFDRERGLVTVKKFCAQSGHLVEQKTVNGQTNQAVNS